MSDPVRDLLEFILAAPTPYHAVAETTRRLGARGYLALDERDAWTLAPGQRCYVVRAEGSVIAWRVGGEPPWEAGVRMVGAHTDSPNLRLRPHPDRRAHGCRQLLVEPYGGVLLHTWFDRDCSLAGRVCVQGADGATRTVLVDLERPLLRVPSLAIHLQREIVEQGFKPNPQEHLHPLWALGDGPDLEAVLLAHLAEQGVACEKVLAWDLMLHDVQEPALSGADGAFVHAPRIDNLASCHAALAALLMDAGEDVAVPRATQLVALWDHEEVGSRSARGAGGTFLRDILSRITGGREALRRTVARSMFVSLDMAHAVHPNHPERHDAQHRPVLGGGPVIKWNANQSYTSDAETGGAFRAVCEAAGVPVQHYAHRSDARCGTTIGPIAAASVGVRTVDVGNPMLSMHSCREVCAAADVAPMIAALRAFFAASG